MRIRTIKPEFWISESVGRLTRDSRLTFIGLWSVADDHGRFRADPRYLAGQLYPYDSDALEVINAALVELTREGSLTLYVAAGSAYGVLNGWKTHQKIDKPSAAKLPSLADGEVVDVSGLAKPREASRGTREGSGRAREPSGEETREGSGEDQGRDQGSGKGRDQGEEAPSAGSRKGSRKPKAQVELPNVVPPPPPRPPTRIGKLHGFFIEERGFRLTDEPPDGCGLEVAEPDEPPNWALSGATLTKWCELFSDLPEEEQDRSIRGMIRLWLSEPYWAAPVDKKTGKPSTPYPWGAFLTEGQYLKAFAKLTADDPKAGAA